MRRLATILLLSTSVAALADASSSQDRPLFPAGSAPAMADGAGAAGAAESGSRTLAAGGAERGFLDEILPTGAALGGTLLAIVLARSAVKRWGGGLGNALSGGKRPSGVVEVLARYPVARGQHVVLLKVARRVLVVHQGGAGMQVLSEFSGADEVADLLARCEAGSRGTAQFSFDSLLRQSSKSHDAAEVSDAPRGARAVARAPSAETLAALPEAFRGAEIERVDLTARRRGGAR